MDGWQPALVAVFLAGAAALLAVPHAVAPEEIPDPMVDTRALARVSEADAARAASAERIAAARTACASARGCPDEPTRLRSEEEAFDFDVRALGDRVRAYGRADAADDEAAVAAEKNKIALAAGAAIARGQDGVLALRAFQTRAFLRAAEQLARKARALGWLDVARPGPAAQGAGRRPEAPSSRGGLWPGRAVLAALYKKRWGEITTLDDGAWGRRSAPSAPNPTFERQLFALTADETRAVARFLLRHPPASGAAADTYRLKKVREMGALDPTYPARFAEGVILFRLQRFGEAAVAFQRHLDASPDGPFTLRAQNHLVAALQHTAAGL